MMIKKKKIKTNILKTSMKVLSQFKNKKIKNKSQFQMMDFQGNSKKLMFLTVMMNAIFEDNNYFI